MQTILLACGLLALTIGYFLNRSAEAKRVARQNFADKTWTRHIGLALAINLTGGLALAIVFIRWAS